MATPITEQPNNLLMGRPYYGLWVDKMYLLTFLFNMLQMTPFIDTIKIVLSQNSELQKYIIRKKL